MGTLIASSRYGRTGHKPALKLERRKIPTHISLQRFSVAVYPLEDSEDGHTDQPIAHGYVTDISHNSFGLILDSSVRCGLAVMLILTAPRRREQHLTATIIATASLPTIGHIVKQNAPGGNFRVAVRFSGENENERRYVSDLIALSPG